MRTGSISVDRDLLSLLELDGKVLGFCRREELGRSGLRGIRGRRRREPSCTLRELGIYLACLSLPCLSLRCRASIWRVCAVRTGIKWAVDPASQSWLVISIFFVKIRILYCCCVWCVVLAASVTAADISSDSSLFLTRSRRRKTLSCTAVVNMLFSTVRLVAALACVSFAVACVSYPHPFQYIMPLSTPSHINRPSCTSHPSSYPSTNLFSSHPETLPMPRRQRQPLLRAEPRRRALHDHRRALVPRLRRSVRLEYQLRQPLRQGRQLQWKMGRVELHTGEYL